jgi:Zn-dependent metalloprotease
MNRCPIHCIVPPQVLNRALKHKDPKVRQAALDTLLQTAKLRGQRSILRLTYVSQPSGGGLHRAIYDAQGQQSTAGPLVRDEGRPPSKDSAVNDVYNGFGATYKLYKDIYHRDSIDGKGMRIEGVVHFGNKYNNAFWNGARMMFGDGDGRMFKGFTKSLDVIGHELTHGVTEFTCALEYHNQSGALNESISDVFGSLVKQYALNQTADKADWLIGAGILGPALKGKALRSMKDPGTAFDGDDQPSNMSGYVKLPDTEAGDNGGVHTNSGIPNHAFYLVAAELGGNAWDQTGQVWFDALQVVKADADFQHFANATCAVAAQRYGTGSKQAQAVADGWDGVGIAVAKPGRPVAIAESPAGSQMVKARLERIVSEIQEAAELM